MSNLQPILLRVSLDITWRDNMELVEAIIKYLVTRTTDLFGVYETPKEGANPHLHFCFHYDGDDVKFRNSFSTLFRSKLTKRINKPIAFSKPKADMDILYLCKGPKAISDLKDKDYPGQKEEPVIMFQGSYSDEIIASKHEEWWSQAKGMKIGKIKKEDKLPEIEVLIQHVEKSCLGIDKQLLPDYDKEQLERCIVRYYRDKRRVIRLPMLIEYIDTIWLILMHTYKRKSSEYIDAEDYIIHKISRYRESRF